MKRTILIVGPEDWAKELKEALGSGYHMFTQHDESMTIEHRETVRGGQLYMRYPAGHDVYVVVVHASLPTGVAFTAGLERRLDAQGSKLDRVIYFGTSGQGMVNARVDFTLTLSGIVQLVHDSMADVVTIEGP